MNFVQFPHTGTFTHTPASAGGGGRKVDGAPVERYSGEVDVQTRSRAQDIQAGIETSKGSAMVFFPVRINDINLAPNDTCILIVEGQTFTGRVDRTDHTDNSCLVLYD